MRKDRDAIAGRICSGPVGSRAWHPGASVPVCPAHSDGLRPRVLGVLGNFSLVRTPLEPPWHSSEGPMVAFVLR